jgi:hypothetical protein
MYRNDLESALKQVANLPKPELPANFEQNVWHEIRSRQTATAPESGDKLLKLPANALKSEMGANR